MGKIKNPCPYHPRVELIRRGRADWYCGECNRSVMLELVYIHQATHPKDNSEDTKVKGAA